MNLIAGVLLLGGLAWAMLSAQREFARRRRDGWSEWDG